MVDTDTYAVVHTATPVRDRIFHAFERVEDSKVEMPRIETHRVAYVRTRVGAAVYRPLTKGDPWLVVQPSTGLRREVPTTRAAGQVLKELRELAASQA